MGLDSTFCLPIISLSNFYSKKHSCFIAYKSPTFVKMMQNHSKHPGYTTNICTHMALHHRFVGFKKPFHLLLQLQTLKVPKLDIFISVPHKTTEIQPKLASMFAKQTKLPKQYREAPVKYKIGGILKVKSVFILKRVNKNYFSDFLTKICCGYASFEHPKQM